MQLHATTGIGLVLAGVICGVSHAAPDDADSIWLARPSFEDQARAYPHEAYREHVSGEAALRCSVKPDGGLADCVVASETPAGMGFGSASLSLADRFRMKPEAVDKIGSAVTVPFHWALAEVAWQSLPDAKRVAALYPKTAIAWNVNGRVRLRCRVKADGTLSDCFTQVEAPEGYGFARATLELAQDFRKRSTASGGKAVEGGMVDILINWHLGDVPFTPVFEVGDGALLVTYLEPGEQPTWSKNRVFTCAFPLDRTLDRKRKCEGHSTVWRDRPSNAAVWRVISHARLWDRETRLSCATGDDGALRDCQVSGDATAQEEAAMRELAKDMKTAPKAEDGVAVQRGRIMLFFDWPRLKFVTMPASVRGGL